MKKLCIIGLLVFLIIFITGCSKKVKIYPVEGPLVDSGQARPIDAVFTWNGMGHGKIFFTLSSGEYCEGEYTTIADVTTATLFGSADYIRYYGSGFSSSPKQRGESVIYGNQGMILQVEYYVDAISNHGYGLGKDNKGNIFKMIF